MHLGTARTAYFNWLAARASGGKFILRIDDTDPERSKPEYTDIILKTMDWLGLDYDVLVRQSERFDQYKWWSEALKDKGWAYDFHGSTMFRLKDRNGLPDYWTDEIIGDVKITENDLNILDNSCLVRNNGAPTYNFASVFDDMQFGVNYIIRGADHITNTSRQIVLWHVINKFTPVHLTSAISPPEVKFPKFAHLGLIHLKGEKLSKRHGASSMLYYQEKGYDPDAMLNFMARMGWGPRVDDKTTKLLPRDRMLELFLEGGTMKSSQANMDLDKLESFDRKYKAKKGIWRNKEKLMQ